MKLRSTFRAPFRFRAVVPAGRPLAADSAGLARLGRSIVVTQLVLLAWCVARAAADWRRGPLGVEGFIAIALAFAIFISLAAKALGWAAHVGRGHGRGRGRPTPSSRSWPMGVDRARAA